jgi:hypothetical protein
MLSPRPAGGVDRPIGGARGQAVVPDRAGCLGWAGALAERDANSDSKSSRETQYRQGASAVSV